MFEDIADRMRFMKLLKDESDDYLCEIIAYCLMSNHYHLIVRKRLEVLNRAIGTLQSRYTRYFNARHIRYGHLFQGRFGSKAIHSDEHLLTVVRYIHLNPVEEGLSITCDYPWSSYREYLDKPTLVSPDLVLGILGGKEEFRAFHEHPVEEMTRYSASGLRQMPIALNLEDAEAIARIKASLGNDIFDRIRHSNKRTRDELLRCIKQMGFTDTRIARITGLGYSIVRRA